MTQKKNTKISNKKPSKPSKKSPKTTPKTTKNTSNSSNMDPDEPVLTFEMPKAYLDFFMTQGFRLRHLLYHKPRLLLIFLPEKDQCAEQGFMTKILYFPETFSNSEDDCVNGRNLLSQHSTAQHLVLCSC